MRNWSGHVQFAATQLAVPASVEELRGLVAASPRVRPLGTAHSFNDIADTDGIHVSVANLPGRIEVDSARRIARVPAGLRYGELALILDGMGWAVHNMASLGHISVAGTVATGTHGSGDRNQTLSASVRGLTMVTAQGDLVTIDEGDPRLRGSVVALGSLGVVTSVDLVIEPAFTMSQHVFDDVSLDAVLAHFDEVFSSAYSVSWFTTWDPDLRGQVWMKRRIDTEGPWSSDTVLDGRLAGGPRHPLPGHDPVHCTEQEGLPGPWHERLPHFRLDFTPSSGDELQTEYLVPRSEATVLLREVAALGPRLHPLLHVSEIRTMAADDLWLSGAFGRDTVGIHVTWQKRPEVLALLADLDALFASRGGRPHWGKLFDAESDSLQARYPRFGDFVALMSEFDPAGKFRNRFMDQLLGA